MTQYVKNLLSDSTVVNQRLLASKKKCTLIVKNSLFKVSIISQPTYVFKISFKKKNEACAIKSSYLSYTFI